MDWAENYISDCLSGIPRSKYRERLRGELEEHLALLVDDLKKRCDSSEEARAEALRQMGDAAALNEGYRAEWFRQPERRRWDLIRELYGCLLAGLSVMVSFPLFGMLWDKWDTPPRHPPAWLFGAVLFFARRSRTPFFCGMCIEGERIAGASSERACARPGCWGTGSYGC